MNEFQSVLDELVVDAPLGKGSWEDVLARSRPSRKARAATVVVAVALFLIVLVATPAFGLRNHLLGLFGGTPVGSERLNAQELHVLSAMVTHVSPRVPAFRQDDLARLREASLREIAVKDGRAYFVADAREGGLCVSIGSVGAPELLGSITCSPDFPSPSRPILDQSRFVRHGTNANPSLARLEGFAANGVASVGVVTVSGRLEAVTPVEDNVYLRTDSLPAESILELVALDANGKRLYSECWARGGCSGR